MTVSSLRDSPLVRRFFRDGEFTLILITGAFFLVLLAGSIGLRTEAAFFPRIIGVAGIVLVAVLVIQYMAKSVDSVSTRPAEDADNTSAASAGGDAVHDESPDPGSGQIMPILAAPAYAVLLVVFGFYIAAGTVIAALPWLLGYRRLYFLIGLAIGTVAALHICFSVLLNIPIPAGIVGDWYLRNFVYLD